jgi:hypothetical protein
MCRFAFGARRAGHCNRAGRKKPTAEVAAVGVASGSATTTAAR